MRRLVWIAIVASGLGWGTLGVGNRALVNRGVPPITAAAYRGLLATAAVIVFLAVARRSMPRGRRTWATATVLAVCNMAVPFVTVTIAVQHASAGFVSLLASLIPLTTALWSHAVIPQERLTRLTFLGLTMAVGGVTILMVSGDSGLVEGGEPIFATVMGLTAVLSIGFARMYARHHAASYDADQMTAAHFAVGTVMLLPLALVVEGPRNVPTGLEWAILLYVALAATVLPFFLLFWLSQNVTATHASLSNYFVPVSGVAAGVIVLGERLQPGIIIAGPLIVGGVLIADAIEHRLKQNLAADTAV